MTTPPTASIAVAWAAVAIVLHVAGVRHGWYGVQGGPWWFDHLTHSVSGGAVMFGLLVLLAPWQAATLYALGLVAWEVGEYVKGDPEEMWVSPRNMTYDLVFSALAALVVWVVIV